LFVGTLFHCKDALTQLPLVKSCPVSTIAGCDGDDVDVEDVTVMTSVPLLPAAS
jgi:hypothetical protein